MNHQAMTLSATSAMLSAVMLMPLSASVPVNVVCLAMSFGFAWFARFFFGLKDDQ